MRFSDNDADFSDIHVYLWDINSTCQKKNCMSFTGQNTYLRFIFFKNMNKWQVNIKIWQYNIKITQVNTLSDKCWQENSIMMECRTKVSICNQLQSRSTTTSRCVFKMFISYLLIYLSLYWRWVLFENFSLICKRHHYLWRVEKFYLCLWEWSMISEIF